MGYYTYFTLDVTPDTPEQLPALFEQITDYSFSNIGNDSIKWYDVDSNMCDISRRFPNHIFTLHGNGKDFDDKWQAVYVNGQFSKVYAELIFPTIDVASIDSIGTRCPEYFL